MAHLLVGAAVTHEAEGQFSRPPPERHKLTAEKTSAANLEPRELSRNPRALPAFCGPQFSLIVDYWAGRG